MARLREGRANTARGAAHFLRETLGRVRYAGAKGQLTVVRADSGFYTHAVVQACPKMKVRFSITVRLRQNLRDLIEAIPEPDWSPIPYWMDGAADVAEITCTPFASQPGATPVRLKVRAPAGRAGRACGYGASRHRLADGKLSPKNFAAHLPDAPVGRQAVPGGNPLYGIDHVIHGVATFGQHSR